MIIVANRSVEAWGPLASVPELRFHQIVDSRVGNTKDLIKSEIKRAKKLKTYKVSFKKEWFSEQFELQAESDWEINNVAREYFKANQGKIGFKEKDRGKWAGDYIGYDSVSYVKVRS